jgi:hypothetical protein
MTQTRQSALARLRGIAGRGTTPLADALGPPAPDPRAEQYKRVSEAVRAARPPSPRARERPAVRAAVAASPRLLRGLAFEWWQISLRPDAWREQLSARNLDLLLVELGAGGVPGWGGVDEAVELIGESTARDIPVVLWVTGPGVDTGVLVNQMHMIERVFVLDPGDSGAWRARWPDAAVRVLPAATAPTQHSPALGGPGALRPGDVALVADSDRLDAPSTTAKTALIAPILGVDAFPDLHLWRTPVGTRYEAEFARAARLRLVAAKLADLSRPIVDQYRVVIDAGRESLASSWTLLDAGAAQTCVVTVPQYRDALPPDLRASVTTAESVVQLRQEVSARARQRELRDREALRLHRAVLAGHTFGHRVRTVLAELGRPLPPADRSVSIMVPTNRSGQLDNVLANAGRQAHPDTELILVLHGLKVADADVRARAAQHGVERLVILRADASLPLGAVLNLGIDAAQGRYVAKMDDDNFYGAHYLSDLVGAFDSTDAGVVGKWAHYVWLRSADAVVLRYPAVEHRYHRLVQGGSIVARRDVVEEFRFSDLPRAVDTDFLNRVWAGGVRTYSADRFNFVSIRGSDHGQHTWKVRDIELMAGEGAVAFYGDPRPHVSV